MGTLLTELQVHALTTGSADRFRAFTALVQSCVVAGTTRIRNDPIARDLVITLDRRARRRAWALDSLRNRFGFGGQGARSVNT